MWFHVCSLHFKTTEGNTVSGSRWPILLFLSIFNKKEIALELTGKLYSCYEGIIISFNGLYKLLVRKVGV